MIASGALEVKAGGLRKLEGSRPRHAMASVEVTTGVRVLLTNVSIGIAVRLPVSPSNRRKACCSNFSCCEERFKAESISNGRNKN